MLLFSLSPLSLSLANPYSLCLQQQDGPEPVANNGEPFHFLPTAPNVLFLQGIAIDEESDNDCSARRTTVGL